MNFFEGIVIGLATITFLGPVFFTLLDISARKGRKAGFLVALGVIVSDIVCASVYYFGFDKYDLPTGSAQVFTFIGAALLLGIGIKYFIQKPKRETYKVKSKNTLISAFLKGFIVNFINPFVFALWAGLYFYAKDNFSSNNTVLTYLSGVLFGIFIVDIFKVLISNRLEQLLNERHLGILFKSAGFVMIAFAIRLLLHADIIF